jgi:septal ring factor EnvC (AmiA/AmiB activator)
MLRAPEQLEEYRFGRYVDPGDPLVMHESHPVYRVETSAAWNLTPGSTAIPSVHATAVSTATAHEALFAELNKQRAAARALADETARTNQHLAELSKMLANTPSLTEEVAAFQKEIDGIKERLDGIDDQIRESKPPAPDIAIPTPDKW